MIFFPRNWDVKKGYQIFLDDLIIIQTWFNKVNKYVYIIRLLNFSSFAQI